MLVKRLALLSSLLWASQLMATQEISVFISFSMPENLLVHTIKDASKYNAPVILRGLYKDSMQETAAKIFELSKRVPQASFQIDPLAFDNYQITQVPAFVVKQGGSFDVVAGNMTIESVLKEVKRHGDLRGSL